MRPSFLSCVAFIPVFFASSIFAKVNVVIVGGGPEASLNQTSLEKNVVYFRNVLNDMGAGSWPQELLFSDGGHGEHTVQYLLPDTDRYRFVAMLEVIFSPGQNWLPNNSGYRPTELTKIDGPATPGALTDYFNTRGKAIPANDQLLFYFTGHGGGDPTRFQTPRNTTLSLWGSPAMPMRDFEKLLDKTNPAVTVMLVMVQCHSGGFANLIYNEGDPKKGLNKQIRFGFFATTAPRLAAGCTSDIQGDDYREFSTAFFAALSGKTRQGQQIKKPDYDSDGITSYMDAFTYVLLTSETVDLPMTTSDQLVRDFSKYGSEPTTKPATTTSSTSDPRLLPETATYSQITSVASAFEKQAIDGLAKVLKLDAADPVSAAKKLSAKCNQDRDKVQTQMRSTQLRVVDARNKLQHAVYFRWPELRDPWLPSGEKLRDEAHYLALKNEIEALPEYAVFNSALLAYGDLAEKSSSFEKTWVKAQRLIDRANIAILKANLLLVATPEVKSRYEQLIKLESGTITPEHL